MEESLNEAQSIVSESHIVNNFEDFIQSCDSDLIKIECENAIDASDLRGSRPISTRVADVQPTTLSAPLIVRVYRKPGDSKSYQFQMENGKWRTYLATDDSDECEVRIEGAKRRAFSVIEELTAEQFDERRDEFMCEQFSMDNTIRARWMIDGASTLYHAARMLRKEAEHLEKMGNDGWELRGTVVDDCGFLFRRDPLTEPKLMRYCDLTADGSK